MNLTFRIFFFIFINLESPLTRPPSTLHPPHLCHLHFGLLENRHCVPKGGFGVISYNSSLRSDVYHIWVNLSPSAITLSTSPYRIPMYHVQCSDTQKLSTFGISPSFAGCGISVTFICVIYDWSSCMCSFDVCSHRYPNSSPNFRLMWMAHMSFSQCNPIPRAKTLGSEHPGPNISQPCAVTYPSHDFSSKH